MTVVIKKKFMLDKLQCLFLLPPKFRKGISQIKNIFGLVWCYPDPNQCSLVDPYPGKEIEVDPDLNPEKGLKGIGIQIRPNAVDPNPQRWP